MRLFKIFLGMAIVVALGSNCVRIDEVKDAQQMVQQTLSKFYAAQEAKDLGAIEALYFQDSTVIALGPENENQLMGWKQVVGNWQRYFDTMDRLKIWRGDEKIRLNFEGNMAWVSSVNQMEITRAGSTEMHRFFFSAVLQKIAGRWQFVQTHISEAGERGLAAKKMGSVARENPQPIENVRQTKNISREENKADRIADEKTPSLNRLQKESATAKELNTTATKTDSMKIAKPDTTQKK